MKKSATTVYLGSPIEQQAELHFLQRLRSDLERRGFPALILANFMAGRTYRQIDFLIVRPDRVVHCEHKAYTLPVRGAVNGPWHQLLPDGTERSLGEENPYRQVQGGTYAISDDMAAVSRRDPSVPKPTHGQFFRCIDSVVCMYPAVLPGSNLERFPYVDVIGYNELLDRLSKPGPHAPWTADHWEAFIRSRGLYLLDEQSAEEREQAATHALLDDYRRRFVDLHGANLHEIVPLTAVVNDKAAAALDLPEMLLEHRTVVLTGGAGTGKTHHARHAAIRLASDGHVPVWLRCGEYEAGRLHVWLGRAVAPYTTEAPVGLFGAAHAAGSLVTLILDGLNECPPALAGELIEEITGLCLSTPVRVLITSQSMLYRSQELPAVTAVIQLPEGLEREALVKSYGAPAPMDVFRGFSTPFELSIAAECAHDLHPGAPRAALFDIYIRRRADERVRAGLRVIARMMDSEVRTALPVSTAIQVLQRSGVGSGAEIVADVLGCPLLSTHPAQLSFTHEIFGRFLAADDLVAREHTGVDLGRLLNDPRHADLRDTAVVLERDPERLRDAVRQLTDIDLMATALRGGLGRTACAVMSAEAEELLAEASFATQMGRCSFGAEQPFDDVWHQSTDWSGFQRALLAAVGRVLPDGLFIGAVINLLERTDDLLAATVEQRQSAGRTSAITEVVAGAIGLFSQHATDPLAASVILEGLHRHGALHRNRWDKSTASVCAAMFDGARPNSWTRLYAALLLLDPKDAGNRSILPALVAAAWDARGYHLRLQALWTARWVAHSVDIETRDAVVAVLERMGRPTNWGLSTSLVEALAAYDAIEPFHSLAEIREQIHQLLANRDRPEAPAEARSIIMNQLEEVEVLGPYMEAVDGLGAAERSTLLLIALQGAISEDVWSSPMATHFILEQVLKACDLDDPNVQAPLIRMASRLGLDDPMQQFAVACHLDALASCSRFCDEPPTIGDEDDERPELRAWRAFRVLVFAIARGEARAKSLVDVWGEILREFPGMGVDVLYQIQSAGVAQHDHESSAHSRLLKAYPSGCRRLLEWGLRHRDQVGESVRGSDPIGRAQYMVRTLGTVGDAGTAALLRSHASDPDIGEVAVAAIRSIERSTGGSSEAELKGTR